MKYTTYILLVLFLCSRFEVYAQIGVGIGTTDPQTTLHVVGTNDNGAVTGTDGVLVPRVTDLITNGTEQGQLVYQVKDTLNYEKGFYYWDSEWLPIANEADVYVNSYGVRNGVKSTDSGNPLSFTNNLVIGLESGNSLTFGVENVLLGIKSGSSLTSGRYNTAFGHEAGQAMRGFSNTAVGYQALGFGNNPSSLVPTTASNNVAIGYRAMLQFGNGSDRNVVVGSNAARGLNGDDNVIIGDSAVYATSGLYSINRSVIIGSKALPQRSSGSGLLNIQNIIYGINNFAIQETISSGNIGIGVKEPIAKLDIAQDDDVLTPSLMVRNGSSDPTSEPVQIAFGSDGLDEAKHSIRSQHQTSNALDFYLWNSSQSTTDLGDLHAMRIRVDPNDDSTANVGVNENAPSQALDVNGKVKANAYIQSIVMDDASDFSPSHPNGHLGTNVEHAVYSFSGSPTIDLPPASTFPSGRILTFKSFSSSGPIVLNAASGDYFDNQTSLTSINVMRTEAVQIMNYNGDYWVVLSEI